jgi:hypothetical protein
VTPLCPVAGIPAHAAVGHVAPGKLVPAAEPVPELPEAAVVKQDNPGLISGTSLPPGVAVGGGQPGHPAESVQSGGNRAAPDPSSSDLPVSPAGQVQALRRWSADSADGLPCHAADNGNAGCAATAAAPPGGDTGLLNTAAGKQAAGRAPEQSRASTGPIRFDAAPIRGPSADPSGAVHSAATRENTREVAGSSAQGYAG